MFSGTRVPRVAIILSHLWAQANELKNNVWPQSQQRPGQLGPATRAVQGQQTVPLTGLPGAPAHVFPHHKAPAAMLEAEVKSPPFLVPPEQYPWRRCTLCNTSE